MYIYMYLFQLKIIKGELVPKDSEDLDLYEMI